MKVGILCFLRCEKKMDKYFELILEMYNMFSVIDISTFLTFNEKIVFSLELPICCGKLNVFYNAFF